MQLQSLSVALLPGPRNTKEVCFMSARVCRNTRRLRSAEMPANSLRWETLQALENSPKAKITFDPHWSERGEVSGYVGNQVSAVKVLVSITTSIYRYLSFVIANTANFKISLSVITFTVAIVFELFIF